MTRRPLTRILILAGIAGAACLALPVFSQSPPPQQGLAAVESRLLAWQTKEARAELEKLFKADNPEHLKAMAEVLIQEGKLDEAKNRLQRAGELAPGDPEVWVQLGQVHAHQKNREAANKSFEKAIEIGRLKVESEGAGAEAHLWLGAALVGSSKADPAVSHLERACDLAGDGPLPFYYLGLSRSQREEWQAAVQLFTRAVERSPRFAYAYLYRGLANSRIGREGDMLADLEKFVALAPDSPDADSARKLIRAAKR